MRDVREMVGRVRRHEIDMTTGKAAVFVVGEPAWHGLGKVIANAVTSEEAIGLAGLDWTVEQWPIKAYKDGKEVLIADRVANVRSDTHAHLAVVGKKYHPMQNVEKFRFMDKVMETGEAKWETAGSVQGGKRVWMLARLPKTLEITKDDVVIPYGLICGGHDGSLAIHIMPTTNRPVCNNTLNLALNDAEASGNQLVVRHDGSIKNNIERARSLFGSISKRAEQFEQQAQALARVRVKTLAANKYVEQFFPTKVKPDFTDGAALLETIVGAKQDSSEVMRDLLEGHYAATERIAKRNTAILETIMANFEADPARGTAWGALNAVTQYVDHQANYRSDDSRLNSVWFGAGDALKQEAFQSAMQMAS